MRQKRIERPFKLHMSSNKAGQGDLALMQEEAREISWPTLIRHVPVQHVRAIFQNKYNWHGNGKHLKDDAAVTFSRSQFKGKKCYFVSYDDTQYIFVGDVKVSEKA